MSKRPSFLADASKAIRPGLATAIVFSLFVNLLAFVGPLYMLQVYDRVLGSRNIGTLVALTIIAGFLLIVYAALEKIRSSILVRLGLLFADKAKIPLFDMVLRGTIVQPGTNQAQALRDLDTIREFLTGTGLIAFCDAPWVPVFVAGCFIMHPWFGYVAGVGALLIFALALANELLTRNQLKDASRNSVLAHSYAAATFRNADVLYAMGMLKGLRDRWSDRHSEGLQLQAGASDRAGFLVAFSKFVRAFLQVAILGVGAYLTVNQETSAGAMVAASIIMGRALAPVEIAVGQWKTFLAARSAYERISNLVKMLPEEGEKIALRPPQGLISVENILVIPPGGKEPVIREVSFALQPGEVLGIIGPNAAGKSSLARALVGVWRPAVGQVRIDGSELAHWNRDQLGPYIGYLPQDIELFSGTLAENISRFGEHDEEKLFAAAEMAGVHELVQGLPDGYNTQVGEGGLALSGGQRQRIGLARALYGKPPLVILDEPNASLDSEGEAALMEAIQELKRARSTVVVITHKTAMLAAVDKLLVLAAGRVSAFGGRHEVLSRLMGGPKIAAVASGATAVRYLSSEAGECVGENNESSRITPLHWNPMQGAFAVAAPETAAAVGAQTARTQATRRSQVRLGFAISTVATAALIGVYFHVEVAAFLTGYNFRELASQELRMPDSVFLRSQAEVEQAKAQVATQDAAQITQAVETSALEARQSLKNEQRSEASANELAALMQEAKAAQAMAADAKPQRRALDLASELAGTQREIETQAAQSQKAVDAATKQKQAAESTIAELQQSLQQEQEKTAALMQEAKAAQAMAADAKPQRRALDEAQARAAALASELAGTQREIETQAAQSQKAVDEAVQQKQTAEAAIAELQQSLQQEQEKTAALMQEAKAAQAMAADAKPQRRVLDEAQARAAALASELAGTRREIETQAAQSQKAVDEAVQQKQTAEAAIAELQQSLQQEQEKTAALMREAKAAQAMAADAKPQRRVLDEAQARAAALASELAGTQREIETQAAQSQKAVDEAVQQKQTAEAAIAELQQLLQQEQEKTAALMQEAKAAQAMAADAKPQRRELDEAQARAAALASELAGTQREIETQAAQSQKAVDEAVQQKQTAEAVIAELQQSLQQEQEKTAALTREVGAARQAMTANAEQQRRALDEAQARAAALASELAGTQREIETQAAQSQKAVDEATKQKQAAESTIAELQQSLQQEQEKTAALMQEAKAAQAMAADAKPQRRVLDEAQARAAALASELAGTRREIETQAAQSQKAVDEATKQKQAAESTIAELQESLQQQRDRAEAMARDLATVQRTMDVRVTGGRSADSPIVHVTQAVKTAVTEPPKAAEAQGNAEAAKLIARASALLGQGDIGAARLVLERASETGSAKASFMLAETYDPAILTAWGTYGTRSEVTKARELYARAHAGGIQEAKYRLNALHQ